MECKLCLRIMTFIAVIVLLLASLSGTVQAYTAAGPDDPQEFEAFIDAEMAALLEEHHIPGGVISVVKDGEVWLTKGYGMANLETQQPFDAENTLVRIASISKLFTWTGIMQLVEQGEITLDDEVQEYLDFELETNYAEPIRIKHLMSHTPGFEDHNLLNGVLDPGEYQPLDHYLATHIPEQIYPPGEVIAYSNYGAGLASYIISQVSGEAWEDYIENHILQPLEMARTTGRQPIPQDLAGDMATSYTYRNGRQIAVPYVYDLLPGAGAISATASDMAHFMLAHLDEGAYGEGRILQTETARQMHSQLYTLHPEMPGYAHGFAEDYWNGKRVIRHSGSWESFMSMMFLVPDEELGVFYAFNGDGGESAVGALIVKFFNHYYPVTAPPALTPPVDFDRRAKAVTGYYRPSRAAVNSLEKIAGLPATQHVVAPGDGTLAYDDHIWIETGPGLFRRQDRDENLAFIMGQDGTAQYLLKSKDTYIRLAWYDSPPFHIAIVAFCILSFLSAFIAWPITALRRRRGAVMATNFPHLARWTAGIAGLLNLVFIIGTAVMLVTRDPMFFIYEIPPAYQILRLLAIVAIALTVFNITRVVLIWRNQIGSQIARWHYTLVVVASLVFTWWIYYWRLLVI